MQLLPHVSEETRNRRKSFVREGEYISYANCGLPYYIGGDCGAGKIVCTDSGGFRETF